MRDEISEFDNNVSDKKLKNLLCMIITHEKSIHNRSYAIWKTWSRYCDKTLFACNCSNVLKIQKFNLNMEIPKELIRFKDIKEMPLLFLNVTEAYDKMGVKVFEIMKQTFNQNPHHEWYLMADDDTYIFMKNLKKFIKSKNPKDPLVYGHKYTHLVPNGYISGGPGIIFSQESMKRLVKKIANKECDKDIDPFGDVSIARCMNRANTSIGSKVSENDKFQVYFPKDPIEASKEAIGMHYVKPEVMFQIFNFTQFF